MNPPCTHRIAICSQLLLPPLFLFCCISGQPISLFLPPLQSVCLAIAVRLVYRVSPVWTSIFVWFLPVMACCFTCDPSYLINLPDLHYHTLVMHGEQIPNLLFSPIVLTVVFLLYLLMLCQCTTWRAHWFQWVIGNPALCQYLPGFTHN